MRKGPQEQCWAVCCYNLWTDTLGPKGHFSINNQYTDKRNIVFTAPKHLKFPGKSPAGWNLLSLLDDGGSAHCDLQCCRKFSVFFPRSVPRYSRTSTDGSFCLCSNIHCSYETLYRRAVASQIMSSLKDWLFLFLLLVNLQEFYTNVVSTLSLWGVVCRASEACEYILWVFFSNLPRILFIYLFIYLNVDTLNNKVLKCLVWMWETHTVYIFNLYSKSCVWLLLNNMGRSLNV